MEDKILRNQDWKDTWLWTYGTYTKAGVTNDSHMKHGGSKSSKGAYMKQGIHEGTMHNTCCNCIENKIMGHQEKNKGYMQCGLDQQLHQDKSLAFSQPFHKLYRKLRQDNRPYLVSNKGQTRKPTKDVIAQKQSQSVTAKPCG
jgi:hypothetical protein